MVLRNGFYALMALTASFLLHAAEPVTAVKVIGDSLSDGGTFGFKFTVQIAGKPSIWVEQVAAHYGLSLCPYFNGKAFKPNQACTNYAIGGGRINYLKAPNLPVSITRQMQIAKADGFLSGDLLLVGGGANDSADLLIAVRNARWGDALMLQHLLESRLDKAKVATWLEQGKAGMEEATSFYMQALAQDFAAHIKVLLNAGAARLVLLNLPDVAKTPRFNGHELNPIKPYVMHWTQRFNDELKRQFADEKRIVLVDFYDEFNRQVANPKEYGFSRVAPACPSSGQPKTVQYDLARCTAQRLSAHIPAGEKGSDWWQRYMFSDDFHPTPYGHQQMADMVLKALKQAGWP